MKAQSSWISEAHGKLGGAVFRHTRHGMVISTKRSPTAREVARVNDSYPVDANLLAKSYRQVYSSAMKSWYRQNDAMHSIMRFRPGWMSPLQWWVYYSYSNALCNGTLLSTIKDTMSKHYPTVDHPTLRWGHCINFPEITDAYEDWVDVSGWVPGFNRTYIALQLSRRCQSPLASVPLLYQGSYLPYSNTGSTLGYIFPGNWNILDSGAGMWVYQRGFFVDRFTGERYKFIDGWYQISIIEVEC